MASVYSFRKTVIFRQNFQVSEWCVCVCACECEREGEREKIECVQTFESILKYR